MLSPSDFTSVQWGRKMSELAGKDLSDLDLHRPFVDEVQFDFASFPFGGDVSTAVFDDEYTEEVRVGSILAFLKRVRVGSLGDSRDLHNWSAKLFGQLLRGQ